MTRPVDDYFAHEVADYGDADSYAFEECDDIAEYDAAHGIARDAWDELAEAERIADARNEIDPYDDQRDWGD